MKTYIKKPDVKNMERVVVELSPYMNTFELDQCLDFIDVISKSQFDQNPSVDDCNTQMKIILGTERYEEVVSKWKEKNQPLLSRYGTKKLRRKDGTDKTLYDGLDPEDNPEDYEEIYV